MSATLSPESAALAAKITTSKDGAVSLPNGTPANRGPVGVKVRDAVKSIKTASKAARKAKPAAKAAPKSPVAAGPSGSERAGLILKALSKHPGGTLQDVMKWTKLGDRAAYHHLWHLRKDGFVRSETAAEVGVVFELTGKGKQAAKKLS